MMLFTSSVILQLFIYNINEVLAKQDFIEEPSSVEVNPGQKFILTCLVRNKAGKCRWEKDGIPVGIFSDKYWWDGNQLAGDCSLVINSASSEFDNGKWQCQVTASTFQLQDTLFSRISKVVVRGKF